MAMFKLLIVILAPIVSSTVIEKFGELQYYRSPSNRQYRCLDVVGGQPSERTSVIIWDCNKHLAQQIVFKIDGSFTIMDRCLGYRGPSPDNHTEVEINDCRPDNDNQWRLTETGQLMNTKFNLCAYGHEPPNNHVNIYLAQCTTNAASSPHWEFSVRGHIVYGTNLTECRIETQEIISVRGVDLWFLIGSGVLNLILLIVIVGVVSHASALKRMLKTITPQTYSVGYVNPNVPTTMVDMASANHGQYCEVAPMAPMATLSPSRQEARYSNLSYGHYYEASPHD